MRYYFLSLIVISSLSRAYVGCYSNGCTGFDGERNKHGVILISDGNKYEWVGDAGVNMHPVEIKNAKRLKKITLYIGKSCDAYSKKYGKGVWSWANGGFIVEFQNEMFGFARQELDIGRDEAFGCSMK